MNRLFQALALLIAPAAIHAAQPLRVASLHTVTTEITQRVGGDRVTVTGLLKPGIDPHDYEPTPADIEVIAGAELIVAAGKGLEGYLTKLPQSSGTRGSFLKVGDLLPSLKGPAGEGGGGRERGIDPHWWQSIAAVEKAVVVVREKLAALRPADAEIFAKNSASYLSELAALRKWATGEIARIPRDGRKLVTTHDAFQYFARDFGFTIYPIRGISTDDEPGSKNVADLIAVIRKQRVKAIFPEAVENPKVMAEITRETGARVAGKLFADGLSVPDASTYAAMYRANVTTIVDALGAK